MLNPPLSRLSDDLFLCIVGRVAELPSPNEHLCNLSIADRTFTQFCQAHIFKVLCFDYRPKSKGARSTHLEKIRNILDDKPSFANNVREVNLTTPHYETAWPRLMNNPTFISIFQLLAKSPRPPHKFHLSSSNPYLFWHSMYIVGRLMQSLTITVLHLTSCTNVPLTLFLVCPGLKELNMSHVEAIEESYDGYPDALCSDREFPALDSLDYRSSANLVEQMISPPPRFRKAEVLWSKLRVLTLCPHEKDDMACLQPILDIACNTLEELYLTKFLMRKLQGDQLSFADLVNLSNLSCLHVFSLCANIQHGVLRDISVVLSTIPTSNKVTDLAFTFAITGQYPLHDCLKEDWAGLCDEVIRISGGKHLNLTFDIMESPSHHGETELCEYINQRITSLSEHPSICTQIYSIPLRPEE